MGRNNSGFSLAEIVIGLFIVTMITVLIGGLGQQFAQFANKSKQVATVLELRTSIAAVSKDPENFIKEMQKVPAGGSDSIKYNTCLQDPKKTLSAFNCPAVKDELLDPSYEFYDEEIKKLASDVYKVTDTKLVDSNGQEIAGTIAKPLYLSGDGLECSATPKNKKCPLMSTGYFFRSNDDTDTDPGSVKFVVKVQSNPDSTLNKSGVSPMKAQYMSINLGRQYASTASCSGTSIQVGVKPSGLPLCLIPVNCGPSSLLVGVKENGSPDCKSVPACVTNKRIVLNDDGDLECVGNSPCDVGLAHLGYYSGTSDPICSSPTSCAAGEVLLGNKCEKIEDCVDTERLTFSNNTFSCSAVATVSGEQCTKAGEFLVGFDAQGKAKCEAGLAGKDGKDGKDGTAGVGGKCAIGSVVQSVNPDGSVDCVKDNTGTGTPFTGVSCEEGFLRGIFDDGSPDCGVPDGDGGGNSYMLDFNEPLPPGGIPTTCIQQITNNAVVRSCSGNQFKCLYTTAPGGTGWHWAYRNTGKIYASCSGGVSYQTADSGTVEWGIYDPMPAGVSPTTHNITCRYNREASGEYPCASFRTNINTPEAKRIPKANSTAGLCYRFINSAKRVMWTHVRKNPNTGAIYGEMDCNQGLRATKK